MASKYTPFRAVVAVSLILFMVAGPFYRHVLGGKNIYLPRWVMFRNAAINLVQVEFSIEAADGEREAVRPRGSHPTERELIVGREDLEDTIAELRHEHAGAGIALIVNARIAKHWGWKAVYDEKRFDLNP